MFFLTCFPYFKNLFIFWYLNLTFAWWFFFFMCQISIIYYIHNFSDFDFVTFEFSTTLLNATTTRLNVSEKLIARLYKQFNGLSRSKYLTSNIKVFQLAAKHWGGIRLTCWSFCYFNRILEVKHNVLSNNAIMILWWLVLWLISFCYFFSLWYDRTPVVTLYYILNMLLEKDFKCILLVLQFLLSWSQLNSSRKIFISL